MKNYKLVYKPETKEKRFLFTNVNIKELLEPITISREKLPREEVVFSSKKKSEQVEYEDEGYKKLREKESGPLILEDNDNRVFAGKMQNLGMSNSCYFAFINTGTSLKVVPIRKWYRFHQKLQTDVIQENDMESVENEVVADVDEEEEKEEIDFDEAFDDDDGEEANIFIAREKKLNSAGRKLKNIMKNYEEKEESSREEVSKSGNTIGKSPGESPEIKVLTKSKVRDMFKGRKIPLKDLLRNVRMHYNLDDAQKELIKEFIAENCTFETEGGSGEKYLVLRK